MAVVFPRELLNGIPLKSFKGIPRHSAYNPHMSETDFGETPKPKPLNDAENGHSFEDLESGGGGGV